MERISSEDGVTAPFGLFYSEARKGTGRCDKKTGTKMEEQTMRMEDEMNQKSR